MSEKILVSTQVTFFYKNSVDEFDKFSSKIKEKFGSGQAQILPLPSSAPSELPRLHLVIDPLVVRGYPNRTDFIFKDGLPEERAVTKLIEIVSESSLTVNKLGFVNTYFADEPISNFVSLLNRELLSGHQVTEVGIMINEPHEIQGVQCNDIEKIDGGTITDNQTGEKKEGSIILRDINTVKGEDISARFSTASLETLISALEERASELLIAHGQEGE